MVASEVGPNERSLDEIHGTVPIPPRSFWRRVLAFTGPALLVSVGYMDPGNWGTDLAAGSKYGYSLIWVLLMSNLMALLLQTLASRLGIVAGRDLAQACREAYPRNTVVGLWVLTEIAIAATDLAEVVGTIIGLKLLLGIPYLWGLAIAAGDTFLLLALQRRGVRLIELITFVLVAIIAGSFLFEIILARPDWAAVLRGFAPGLPADQETGRIGGSLYVAIGMLGATVMPHNLYLHSALVQSRAFPRTGEGKALACRYNLLDSAVALNVAFFINSAILVLAAATFFTLGREVETLQEAHKLLGQVWGTTLASVLFALALLASGQSSTLTGTLAGQVVMEGFVRLRLRPWARRLLTRSLAILPALLVLSLTTGGQSNERADALLLKMLVLSQVILGFQLPFAILPLIQLTSDRQRMGEFANPVWMKGLAWLCAVVILSLNVVGIVFSIQEWGEAVEKVFSPWWVYATVGPLAAALAVFLGWVGLYPYLRRAQEPAPTPALAVVPPLELAPVQYRRIGVAVEFTDADALVLRQAVALARQHGASLLLMHVVEGPGAAYYGEQADDRESREDRLALAEVVRRLRQEGLGADGVLGFGNPADELVRLARERELDLLVLGTHGHRFLADLALGHTVAPVLHQLSIPVLVVPSGARAPEAGKDGQMARA